MTNVQIIYNPFEDETRVFYEEHEILSEDNKIVTFLKTNGFYECLHMFKKRYVIWQGLLPEIIKEVNDDELQIVFEGNDDDFKKLEAAFCESKDIVNNMGYENNWSLSHISNFTLECAVQSLTDIIEEFKSTCETRAELAQLDKCIEQLEFHVDTYSEFCTIRKSVEKIFNQHIDKWQKSDSPYKQSKIVFIEVLLKCVNQ